MHDEIDKIRKEFQQREQDSIKKLEEEIKQLEQELIKSQNQSDTFKRLIYMNAELLTFKYLYYRSLGHLELKNIEFSTLQKELEILKHKTKSITVRNEKIASTTSKIFLLGIDGASWKIIDPLILRDMLPNFKKIEGRRSLWETTKSLP